jgi:hypothetical protein
MSTETKQIDDGGPAMGLVVLNLRDYFAGQALNGLLASDSPEYAYANDHDSATSQAYLLADAMLKARKDTHAQ